MTYKTLLIEHADALATMDDAGTEWRDASVFIRGPAVEWVGRVAPVGTA